MLIRAYGEFWNPDAVYWGERGVGNRGRLEGRIRKRASNSSWPAVDVDMWGQSGIYVLYENFRPAYIGQANNSIGQRLKDHLTDRHAGRWDMFSWFGVKIVKQDGSLRNAPLGRGIDVETLIKTMESLGIAMLDPPMNRRHESIPGADLVEQRAQAGPATVRHYLETILKKLETK
jgi:hypothetical protein